MTMESVDLDSLIKVLTGIREEVGGGAEVRLMTQQNWPFENRILGVTTTADMNEEAEEAEEADEDDVILGGDTIVYLVEGGQICYGSKRAWETARRQ